jgi:hypothetical protein
LEENKRSVYTFMRDTSWFVFIIFALLYIGGYVCYQQKSVWELLEIIEKQEMTIIKQQILMETQQHYIRSLEQPEPLQWQPRSQLKGHGPI